jgi:hypothetical protein
MLFCDILRDIHVTNIAKKKFYFVTSKILTCQKYPEGKVLFRNTVRFKSHCALIKIFGTDVHERIYRPEHV